MRKKLPRRDWLVLGLTLIAALLIVSYQPSPQLPPALVKRAITLQLTQASQVLAAQLDLDDPASEGFQISNIKITQETRLMIQNLPTVQVRGTYDFTGKPSKRPIRQVNNPFEIYLQAQSEGKTWRLARPLTQDFDSWATRRINP